MYEYVAKPFIYNRETAMEFEKDLSRPDMISFLRQLADALENDSRISVDQKSLTIPATADFSLEYEEEGDNVELELEINWSKVERAKAGKFELFKGKNNSWYFRLKAGNGQTILTSQKYSSKQAAVNGVSAVKKNSIDSNIEYRESQSGQPYFVLKSSNGQIIGTSQMYRRKAGCEKGARSVVNHAGEALVDVV